MFLGFGKIVSYFMLFDVSVAYGRVSGRGKAGFLLLQRRRQSSLPIHPSSAKKEEEEESPENSSPSLPPRSVHHQSSRKPKRKKRTTKHFKCRTTVLSTQAFPDEQKIIPFLIRESFCSFRSGGIN